MRKLILGLVLICGSAGCNQLSLPEQGQGQRDGENSPTTREYWIAVEPETWNIAPGPDAMSGKQIPAAEATYNALRFFAYSAGFKERLPADPLLGIAGPVIEATVGDQVVIHFRNNDRYYHQPHSLHLHGLRYDPDNDGGYMAGNPADPSSKIEEGAEHTYHYSVPDDSVGVWPYHDHSVDGAKNTDLGLYGAVRVHSPSEPAADREFYVFLSGLEKDVTGLGRDFDTINGHAYMGNTPHFMVKRGSMVRFNVVGFGAEFHTFHIHGYHWQHDGQSEDVRLVGPATAWSISFRADNPGMWMYHCHVEEHVQNGMMGMFMVE